MGDDNDHKKKAEVIRFLCFIGSKTPPVSFGDHLPFQGRHMRVRKAPLKGALSAKLTEGLKISLLRLRC